MEPVHCCDTSTPVLVEVLGDYDGGLFYQCVKCFQRWHRFPKSDPLYQRAKPYVDQKPFDGAYSDAG